MEIFQMKIVSIKRLVLSLVLGLGSVMTLPAYAWPDTDEMNMCGAAVKNVRAYGSDFRGWAAHDIYISARGLDYYYRTNCPESKATKNYKGKNWTPGAKMVAAKPKRMMKAKARKARKFNAKKRHAKHNPNHKNHADCIRTDALNTGGAIVKKVQRRVQTDAQFLRQAHALLNMKAAPKSKMVPRAKQRMSKVKRVSNFHNPNHKNHADCVRTDGLNKAGAIVKVVRRR